MSWALGLALAALVARQVALAAGSWAYERNRAADHKIVSGL